MTWLTIPNKYPVTQKKTTGTQTRHIPKLTTFQPSYTPEKIKVTARDVIKEIPESTKKVIGGIANFLAPGLTKFAKTSMSIFGEGLAYALDKNVRKQYEAGGLDILPTITETTIPKMAKYTLAAGIEAAVLKSFPGAMKMNIFKRAGVGALEGLGFAISSGLAEDKTPEEIVKSLPSYGIMGSVASTISPYLLPVLKSEFGKMPLEVKNAFKGLEKEIKLDVLKKPVKIGVKTQIPETISVPVKTPKSRYAEYLKSQGYEPYQIGELPTIEMGIKPKSEFPSIQIGEELPIKKLKGELTYAPIEIPKRIIPKLETFEPVIEKPTIPTIITPTITPVEKLLTKEFPTQKPAGLAESLKKEARIKNFTAEFGESPIYETRSLSDALDRGRKLVDDNPVLAEQIIKGEKTSPTEYNVFHSEVYSAMKEKAFEEGDIATLYKLATDKKINAMGTEAGRIVKGYDVGLENDPVIAIREISEARQKGVEIKRSNIFQKGKIEKITKNEINNALENIKKSTPKKQTWAEFIRTLKC